MMRLREEAAVCAMVALYVSSRLPLVRLGFGNDSDAWSMASNASDVIHGTYRVSRLPGHPVYEALYSTAAVLGGPLVCNLLTVGLSLIVLAMVGRLGGMLEVDRPGWAVAAAATQPIFWIASADSTDFMLATLLGLAAILAGMHGRSVVAGALLGMAAATRIETVLFVIPVAVMGRGLRLRRVLASAAIVGAILFAPVAASIYRDNWRGWFSNVLLMPRTSAQQRMLGFVSKVWATWGIVSLAVLGWLIVAQRRRVVSLLRQRDPLFVAVGGLGVAYVGLTLLNHSKSTYYVPLLPLILLAVTKIASTSQRALLIAAFVVYAIVYPDVVDQVDGRLQLGFRLNNGIVVKDWIARWNTAHAADLIEQDRPHGSGVLILGYWLPVWRAGNAGSVPEKSLPTGIPIDLTLNRAYRTSDGTWVVHNVDQASVARLSAAGVPVAYGEGIDAFLREIHGYDVKAYGAVEVRVRTLGGAVSEHFVLPAVARCAFVGRKGDGCGPDAGFLRDPGR